MTAFWVASPVLLSALLPPVFAPYVVGLLRPMVDYFEYEHILESSPVDTRQRIIDGKENYLIVAQPHGVLSFTGICSGAVYPEFLVPIKTAVASAVLYTPIIKHVMGIFGLCDASKGSLKKQLKKTSVVLYVGGIAELFLSCPTEERVFLKKRKGFIKLALVEGVDIIPIYLFGNTSILTVVKTGLLAQLSRKLQVSLTYFWGKFGLPIPRDDKLLYVGGQPLGMPHLPNPTQEDIDNWHAKYCDEVRRLFDTYKERVPQYKHKKLIIM